MKINKNDTDKGNDKVSMKKIIWKIVLLIICVGINFVGRKVAEELKLPVWLDCVGTGVSAYFAGPVIAILTAIISQFIAGIKSLSAILYTITAVVVALSLNHCVKRKYTDSFSKMIIASFWIGILCVIFSTPLNLIFNDGYSGNMWGDALVDMLEWYGMHKMFSALAGEIIVEIVDKQICVILIYLLIKLILHLRNKNIAKKVVSGSLGFVLLTSGFLITSDVFAVEPEEPQDDNYISTIYDNSSGMMSSEANVIEQTDDGTIWIGSYAGLTKYNGSEFEFIREGGSVNVTAMLCDSKGRLWVGTNDGGIVRYDNGNYEIFSVDNGLSANSIRCFSETEDGIVYVGTTDCICRFDADDNITFVHKEVKYVVSIATEKDILVGIDNNGNAFVLKDDKLLNEFKESDTGVFCQCIENTTEGILVGTTEDVLYEIDIDGENVEFSKTNYKVLQGVCGIEEGNNGLIWICAEGGFGYANAEGKFTDLTDESFSASFECIKEDYQGNIWLASSRYGVLKLSEGRFSNLFEKAGIENIVVNAIVEYQGMYYCGTDSGLVMITEDGTILENDLTNRLETVRIRCLLIDSSDRIWISTYGEDGLIRYDTSGKIETFNMNEKGATSDRFRCTLELSDGVIVAGTADGINFIKEDEIFDTITTVEDNLANSQILTLVEDEDGTVYAGSDGGGIYAIRNGEVEEVYTTKDGLSSNIILRMIPYDNGYFIVTSNSLCYMKEKKIEKLDNFPYFNNYDIIMKGDMAYVLSSAGIYIADAKEMCSGKEFDYELLGPNDGLDVGLTANSWSYLDEIGNIFLCSNNGMILYIDEKIDEESNYRYGITSVSVDGKVVTEEDGIYHLPVDAKLITIRASVQNYTLQDVKVRFFVEGINEELQYVSYKKLEPIQISNLSHGNYNVHIQILDSHGKNVVQETVYKLKKEAQIWEHIWYKIYLIAVCIELIIFGTWTVINMLTMSKQKNELEKMRQELEEKVAQQIELIKEQEEKEVHIFRNAVMALSDAVDAKDRYTSGHSKRVAEYARTIAARMGKSEQEQEEVYYAGLLHDIGKIRVPEAVINKPGRLTDEEFDLIKMHPLTSYHILKDISEDSPIAIGAKFHHERYDGKGYPSGLSETNIPEVARILGVADSYDAMTSNRSYRDALPQEVVKREIKAGRGTQFDPVVADIMVKMIEEDQFYTMKQAADVKKKILAIDDDPLNIKVIQLILKEEDMYDISGVNSGKEAIQFLDENEVDLILLDIEMPEMNGFEALTYIRKKTDVPVVFMTGDKELDTIQKATSLGVEDYLTKPFLAAALKEVIYSILK